MMGLESLIALLAGGLFGGGSGGSSSGNEVTQGLMEQVLQQQKERMLIQNPLYERTNQLAMSLLPKSANVANPVLYNPYSGGGQSYPRDPRLPPENRRVPTEQGPNPGDNGRGMTQAIQMLASGIAPMNQAKLFRR